MYKKPFFVQLRACETFTNFEWFDELIWLITWLLMFQFCDHKCPFSIDLFLNRTTTIRHHFECHLRPFQLQIYPYTSLFHFKEESQTNKIGLYHRIFRDFIVINHENLYTYGRLFLTCHIRAGHDSYLPKGWNETLVRQTSGVKIRKCRLKSCDWSVCWWFGCVLESSRFTAPEKFCLVNIFALNVSFFHQ